MNNRCRLWAAIIVVYLGGSAPVWAQASGTTVSPAAASCKALESVDFTGIPDAPTQLTEAKFVEASDGEPALCLAKGYVFPQVGIELRLPVANWNGKFLEVGCGGQCGVLSFSALCRGPLRKGYACIASDNGHTGSTVLAGWAYNNLQAQVDWGYRGAHVAALAGKAITQEYYHHDLTKSYFWGCSTGGHEALVEAQRFPWDFDGIVAGGALDVNSTAWIVDTMWAVRALTGEDGNAILSEADAEMLHEAVIAKCDMDDGVKDGIISNPRGCKFDPEVLQCKGSKTSSCLTGEQIQAVKKVYAGAPPSIVDRSYTVGAPLGSELRWVTPYSEKNTGESFMALGHYLTDLFRYYGFWPAPGPSWKLSDFDLNRDGKRLGMYGALSNATNPDLRKFASLGGKLIAYFGLLDEVTPDLVDYHAMVERVMGSHEAAQNFFRLFGIPGQNHCTSGPGAFAIDYLSYLEAWVEKGQAPDKMIGAHADGVGWKTWGNDYPWDPKIPIAFTRPVYPYPAYAKYKGTGDPNDAANFVPVNPR
jgi:Tannase and feruloyl esterase